MTLGHRILTAEAYLARERRAQTRSEFFEGHMYAVAGADEAHNLLMSNIVTEINLQFRGRPCKVYPRDMRVKIPATGLYTYPDVTALCGEALFEDAEVDTLTNPALVVEVLSYSTEAYDRGDKFAMYRTVPSLTDYVLVSDNRVLVEHYSRQTDGSWRLIEKSTLDETLDLPSMNVRLSLANLYDKVDVTASRARHRKRRRPATVSRKGKGAK